MALRFFQEASNQLAPAYNQQISAVQGQLPAIQQLYQSLVQGLQSQQAVGNQNILEGASSRGLLHSTIPVDAQAGLGAQILQQQGQYAQQQAKDVGGIYSQVAGIQGQQAGAIANLANSLAGTDLQQQQIANQNYQAERAYQLQQQTANQQYQLALQAARRRY